MGTPDGGPMNLAGEAAAIEPGTATSPWPNHEHVRGYAALELPFSSGHLLGLRVWPETDFTPWTSVWHRTPGGEWSIYNDGPSLETTCPRYWGPALERAELATIDLTWTGPNELHVEMDEPSLDWTMSMVAPPLLRALNATNASLPLWSWRPAPLLWLRELVSKHLLGLGDVRFSFTAASGHEATIVPQEVYYVDDSEAVLGGGDLGEPVRLEENPTIGGVPTPTRPVFVFGQAHMQIRDEAEYRRARERAASTSPSPTQSPARADTAADGGEVR